MSSTNLSLTQLIQPDTINDSESEEQQQGGNEYEQSTPTDHQTLISSATIHRHQQLLERLGIQENDVVHEHNNDDENGVYALHGWVTGNGIPLEFQQFITRSLGRGTPTERFLQQRLGVFSSAASNREKMPEHMMAIHTIKYFGAFMKSYADHVQSVLNHDYTMRLYMNELNQRVVQNEHYNFLVTSACLDSPKSASTSAADRSVSSSPSLRFRNPSTSSRSIVPRSMLSVPAFHSAQRFLTPVQRSGDSSRRRHSASASSRSRTPSISPYRMIDTIKTIPKDSKRHDILLSADFCTDNEEATTNNTAATTTTTTNQLKRTHRTSVKDEDEKQTDGNDMAMPKKRRRTRSTSAAAASAEHKEKPQKCMAGRHTEACESVQENQVLERMRQQYTSQPSLDALHALVDACRDEDAQQRKDEQVLEAYNRMITKRNERMVRMYEHIKNLMMNAYMDSLIKYIATRKERMLYDNEGENMCLICSENGATHGILNKGCKCGAIGHLDCLLQMCFTARMDKYPSCEIKCPHCRKVFVETDLVEIMYKRAEKVKK